MGIHGVCYRKCPKILYNHVSDKIAYPNSADLDQTAPEGAVCLFVLRFYGPVNPMGSCRARSVYLQHIYWAGLVL